MTPNAENGSKRFSLLVRAIVVMVLLFGGLGWLMAHSVPDVEEQMVEAVTAEPTATAVVKSPDEPLVLTAEAAELINARATAEAELALERAQRYKDLPGLYDIRGTNPVSGTYNGQLRITDIGSYHGLEWVINSEVITGTGLLYDEAFAVSWGGPNCKAIVYRIREDGQLGGAWYLLSRPDTYGLEVVEPLEDEDSENFLVGTHRVFGQNTDGERYYGSVEFGVTGSVYTADWQFDGGDITATGVRQNDVLSFGWGDTNCSIAIYTVSNDGTLDGVWADVGELWLGTELGEKVGR